MILIISPYDKSTKRLGRIASFLHRHLPNNKLFIVRPNEKSKLECHKLIWNCKESDLIIFLGHARSDALYGAKGKYYKNPFAPNPNEDSNPEDYEYYDENFIDSSSFHLLKGKKMICYGCKTKKLAEHLYRSGALVIYGFGVIPTSMEEFKIFHEPQVSNLLISYMKGSITRILKRGICLSLSNPKNSFADLYKILEFEFQREIEYALTSNFRLKFNLVNVLHIVKREMGVIGDISCKLLR